MRKTRFLGNEKKDDFGRKQNGKLVCLLVVRKAKQAKFEENILRMKENGKGKCSREQKK